MSTNKEVTPDMIKQAGELLKKEHNLRVQLEKEAQASTLEKRAQKIAFREVELGIAEPFKSLEEFQKKIASLLEEGDLEVVEKALERGYTSARKTGALDENSSTKGMNVFERYVRTGELDNE